METQFKWVFSLFHKGALRLVYPVPVRGDTDEDVNVPKVCSTTREQQKQATHQAILCTGRMQP